jgi:F0F1-type ATP synthase assembly protein I
MKLFLFRVFQYAFYPLLLTVVLGTCIIAINNQWNYSSIYGLVTLFLVATLMIFEYIFPLKEEWKMTMKSFFRDIKYIAVDIPIIA